MLCFAGFPPRDGLLCHREVCAAVGGTLAPAATAILWRASTPARVVVRTIAPAGFVARCSFAGVAASLEGVLAIPARRFPLPATNDLAM